MNKKIYYFFIAYFISIALTLNMQVIPPLIPNIIKEWNIQRAQAGLLMGIVSIPPLLFGILGGYILDNFGVKIPTIISLFFYLLGEILFILAKNFIILLISRLIIGFGAVVLAVVGLKILAEKFQGKDFGKVMGFNNTAMPISALISFNLFGFIASKYSWKIPMMILVFYSFFLILLISLFYKEEQKIKNNNIDLLSSIKDIPNKVWILGILWLLFNAGSLSFLTFAPDYFVSKGFSYSLASSISSLYMIGAIFSPFIGHLLDRTSKPQLLIFIGSFFLSILLLLIYFLKSAIVLIIIAGLFSALIPPSVFYLLPKFTNKFGLGYSILSFLINVGIFSGPALVGYIKDISGSYFPSFLLMAVLVFSSGILGITFLSPKSS